MNHVLYDSSFADGEFQTNGFNPAAWTTYHQNTGRKIFNDDAFYNDSSQFSAYPTFGLTNDPLTGDQNVLALSAFPVPAPIATNPALAIPAGQAHNGAPFEQYLSAYLETSGPGQFEQRYGYWEARIRESKGQGLWPNFDMFSSRSDPTPETEWDIAELIDQDQFINQQYWYNPAGNRLSGITGAGAYHQSFDPSAAYHNYGVLVLPTGTTWYVDGIKTLQSKANLDWTTPHGEYIVLALQVGDLASWLGAPNSSTVWPATMYVQHVRAFSPTTTGC